MTLRILTYAFITFLLVGTVYLLYDYNTFAEEYTSAQMEILRSRAKMKNLQNQIQDFQLERSLAGLKIPRKYVEEYLHNRKTLVMLATSQDCSPCTEKELGLWEKFMIDNELECPLLCLYYRFTQSQYGKYEDVYREIFPFAYDELGLYEYLRIEDTPIVMMIEKDGRILFAHRPDVMHAEKTEEFLKMLIRISENEFDAKEAG